MDPLAWMLGRPPKPEERAIFEDQLRRLEAVWNHPLIRTEDGLAVPPPFEDPSA
ncbi:hypothetical protein [Palleronia sp. LCG004]|uniref:hypothetical protein n=1 Tax=Palleronia sp. LCG004 TaxID=3079304 RepID=UPI0029422715|nr:hypothetical protein [Palleronia sp. LCG004]WOI58017.1 hypothetical protein RVY76_16870 [Palleronia sp. LCG004]